MNNYMELSKFLEKFTQDVNKVYMNLNQREAAVKDAVELLNIYITEHNRNSDVKVKEIGVHENCLVLFQYAATILLMLSKNNNNIEVYHNYEKQVYQMICNYVSDERFFNLNDIRRKVSIYGSAEIKFSPSVTNLLCNTASVMAIRNIVYSLIQDNENEGTQYIMEYIKSNFLSLQSRIGVITINIE